MSITDNKVRLLHSHQKREKRLPYVCRTLRSTHIPASPKELVLVHAPPNLFRVQSSIGSTSSTYAKPRIL